MLKQWVKKRVQRTILHSKSFYFYDNKDKK